MPMARRGLVAPQNTFLENIIRRSSIQHSNFILANARVVDYPIVYSNDGFCKMTGYNRADCMQRSSTCNFMYGELTNQDAVKSIQEAFEKLDAVQVELLIYKKSRTPMWTLVQIAPVKNEKDQVVLFLCVFKDITSLKQPIEDESAKGVGRFAKLARTVTRSRSVLVQVAQHLPNMKAEQTKQTQISQISHMMSLDAEVLPQYKREAPKTPPHIILHYCTFKTIWDWVILVLTFYTAVAVPFNVTFSTDSTPDFMTLVVIDGIVDIVFFIDVILNFHTTFVGPSGEVVSEPKIIRMNYLKSWFIIDLLSCLPYDVINAFQSSNNKKISGIFSALKVARLLRLGRVVRKLDHYIEYGLAFLILLMLSFLLFAHWLACAWYAIGYDGLRKNDTNSWLLKFGNDMDQPYHSYENGTVRRGPDIGNEYVSALYYTMSSLTSVGFGNISSNTLYERLFTIGMMVIGSLLYACIFGNVTTIYQQFTSNTARYHDMLHNVKEFMKLHGVNKPLTERVLDYVISTWSMSKGIDTEKVLSYCPKDMKADVCVHLNRRVFNEHPSFRLASEGCLRALAINFNMSHSAPGDLLVHSGESIDSLCFVVSGSLEVIQDDEVVAILGKGDVYGDAFWKEAHLGQSAANVKSLTYCDLHSIKRDDLLDVLDFYTSFATSFARNMVLTYNLRHRLIFRKVADVKREMEEAKKRKNEPPIPADHPVRKMLNKFRKLSDVPDKKPPPRKARESRDVEKGDSHALTRVPEHQTPPPLSAVGRVRSVKMPDAQVRRQDSTKDVTESKWGPLKKIPLRKAESTDSGILRSEQRLDEIGRADSKDGNSSASTSSTDHHLLASLMEIKLELKEEIESLGVKMTRLDDQIADIIKIFSPDVSQYSSSMASSSSSQMGSCNEVPLSSPQKSPMVVQVREQGETSSSSESSGLGEQRSSSVTSTASTGSRQTTSSSGGRSPSSIGSHRGPPPVESTLNLLDHDAQAEGGSLSEIESPPSPGPRANPEF
ncbi:voltage-gated delayed rectifier potassium channel KCNH1-like isoform X1 [Diadema antillarum]|uniref:voltage-gated delayed rectifier potassium channel KCNH1-like isoform X1 n=1 Tax=Diadema antillarum TaxID=105358 RepID=UPI003A8B162E